MATASVAMMVVLGSVPLRPWIGPWGVCKHWQVDRLETRGTAWTKHDCPVKKYVIGSAVRVKNRHGTARMYLKDGVSASNRIANSFGVGVNAKQNPYLSFGTEEYTTAKASQPAPRSAPVKEFDHVKFWPLGHDCTWQKR